MAHSSGAVQLAVLLTLKASFCSAPPSIKFRCLNNNTSYCVSCVLTFLFWGGGLDNQANIVSLLG